MKSLAALILIMGLLYINPEFESNFDVDKNLDAAAKTYYSGILVTYPKLGTAATMKYGLITAKLDGRKEDEMHPHGCISVVYENNTPYMDLLNKEVLFTVDKNRRAEKIIKPEDIGPGDRVVEFKEWPINLDNHDEIGEGRHKIGVINTLEQNSGIVLLGEGQYGPGYTVNKVIIDNVPYWCPRMMNGDSLFFETTDVNVLPYQKIGNSYISLDEDQAYKLIYSISNMHWHELSGVDANFLISLGINVR